MKIYEIFFSPTGGTKKAADMLAAGIGEEIVPVDLTDPQEKFRNIRLEQEDVAVVAVPSYGGRVPAAAVERLGRICGNGAGAVLLCVYGNRAYEDTLLELRDTAIQSGFYIIAAVSAVAEHSIARRFAAGRPDEQDHEQLAAFAGMIRKKISEGKKEEPHIPGSRPYKKRANFGMVPKPSGDCIKCGVCARECPVQAIDKKDPGKTDSKLCISCMRCISVCPHSARKLNRIMMAAANTMLKKVCSDRKKCEIFL